MIILQKLFITLAGLLLLISPTFANTIEFLTLSDIHLNQVQRHVMQIDPSGYDASNDMDHSTFTTILSLIKHNIGKNKLIPTPKFILYLGDMVGHQHTFDFNRKKLVADNESAIFTALHNLFPRTPIISIFGNNDSFEKDYGHFLFQDLSPYNIAMQSGFKNGFLSTGKVCGANLLPQFPCLLNQNTHYGFFSIKVSAESSTLF